MNIKVEISFNFHKLSFLFSLLPSWEYNQNIVKHNSTRVRVCWLMSAKKTKKDWPSKMGCVVCKVKGGETINIYIYISSYTLYYYVCIREEGENDNWKNLQPFFYPPNISHLQKTMRNNGVGFNFSFIVLSIFPC